jgi:hypothetical protein
VAVLCWAVAIGAIGLSEEVFSIVGVVELISAGDPSKAKKIRLRYQKLWSKKFARRRWQLI